MSDLEPVGVNDLTALIHDSLEDADQDEEVAFGTVISSDIDATGLTLVYPHATFRVDVTQIGASAPFPKIVKVFHEPYGWGPTKVPSLQTLKDLLNMVSCDPPGDYVHWSEETKIAVANWATQEHLEASDNVISDEERLPKPEVLW